MNHLRNEIEHPLSKQRDHRIDVGMGKGRFVIQSALMAAALAGFAWLVLRPHEPMYHGKPLSYWLQDAYQRGAYQIEASNTTAEKAIHELGANSVPYLIRLASTRYDSAPRRLLEAFAREPNLATLHLPRQEYKLQMSIWGFRLLGPQAKDAVPALIRLLTDKDGWTRMDAAACLARIGPEAESAVPALLAGLQATNINRQAYQNLRYWSLFALGEMGSRARSAVPQLETMTNDVAARLALIKIRQQPRQPFLEQLKDMSDPETWRQTAWLVGSLGTNAEPAIPLLLDVVAQSNLNFRATALGVLGDIHRQPDLCVPVIIPFLRSTNMNVRRMALYSIREFGAAAKPAVPDILRCLNDPDSWIQQQSTNALMMIDPAAAATLLNK
jgi:HEAT repeat protein